MCYTKCNCLISLLKNARQTVILVFIFILPLIQNKVQTLDFKNCEDKKLFITSATFSLKFMFCVD